MGLRPPAQKVQAGSSGWRLTKPSADGLAPYLGPFLPSLFQCPPGHPFSNSAASRFFPLSLLLSCYFPLSSLLSLLSCALEPCGGRLLSQLRLQSVGPLPRSQCGKRKGRREGLLEESTHSLGVPGLGFIPRCLCKRILCVSASPSQ